MRTFVGLSAASPGHGLIAAAVFFFVNLWTLYDSTRVEVDIDFFGNYKE